MSLLDDVEKHFGTSRVFGYEIDDRGRWRIYTTFPDGLKISFLTSDPFDQLIRNFQTMFDTFDNWRG